jgi:hypothetical protein
MQNDLQTRRTVRRTRSASVPAPRGQRRMFCVALNVKRAASVVSRKTSIAGDIEGEGAVERAGVRAF